MAKFEHCIFTPNQEFTQSKIEKAKDSDPLLEWSPSNLIEVGKIIK